MCVDLFTGETCFYKYGAAPSYVKSGKSIRRIKCETLAAGISMGSRYRAGHRAHAPAPRIDRGHRD